LLHYNAQINFDQSCIHNIKGIVGFYNLKYKTTTCEMQCVAITRNRNEIKIPPHQNKNKTNKC